MTTAAKRYRTNFFMTSPQRSSHWKRMCLLMWVNRDTDFWGSSNTARMLSICLFSVGNGDLINIWYFSFLGLASNNVGLQTVRQFRRDSGFSDATRTRSSTKTIRCCWIWWKGKVRIEIVVDFFVRRPRFSSSLFSKTLAFLFSSPNRGSGLWHHFRRTHFRMKTSLFNPFPKRNTQKFWFSMLFYEKICSGTLAWA